MIIFGWGKNCKEIGKGLIRECPNCKNIRQWIIVQTSKKVSLYFVPVMKWNKEYFFICPVCNNGIQLENRDDAHKIMEAAIEQEAEIRKLQAEPKKKEEKVIVGPDGSLQLNPDGYSDEEKRQMIRALEAMKKQATLEGKTYEDIMKERVEMYLVKTIAKKEGLDFEAIKKRAVEEGCSVIQIVEDIHRNMKDKKDDGGENGSETNGDRMDNQEIFKKKVIHIFAELANFSPKFHSEMLNRYPNMKRVDTTYANTISMLAGYCFFLDLITLDKISTKKVKEISGIMGTLLNGLNPQFVELIDECQQAVVEQIRYTTSKHSNCNLVALKILSYGSWVFQRLFLRPASTEEEMQAFYFGNEITSKVTTFWSEHKESLLPF